MRVDCRDMRLRRTVAMVLSLGLTAASASAQSAEFVARLTRGSTSSPGAIVQPFIGDTSTSGWVTLTIDRGARTLSYNVVVVNAPGGATGRLLVSSAGAAVPVLTFAPPVPMSIVLNNIVDDLCYDTGAISFEGTIPAAELRLQPEQGIRSADDIFQAVAEGKVYVEVTSIGNPGTEIRGQLTKKN
jgi:hypothetical protein